MSYSSHYVLYSGLLPQSYHSSLNVLLVAKTISAIWHMHMVSCYYK